ncbi:MAG: maleylpyruvate isomerase family mycothiol-dependent enzyme [Actinobacteria bacterium]|nr:maleylpyruvate isomerase family mycothiol-dependent enzyme [Actinomycetota bacterium]
MEDPPMYGIPDGIAANQREVTAIIDRARTLTTDDWARSVLPGWSVLDMLDHVARALAQQAEAFERGLRGELDPPEFPNPQAATPAKVIDDLVAGLDALQRALAKLVPESMAALTPMPFGVIPTPVALQIAVVEYGMHRWDLERACGSPTYDLSDDVAAASIAMVPGLLPMLAGRTEQRPAKPAAFQLASPVGAPIVVFDGEQWAPAEATDIPTTVISGSASDLTMFYIGRLNASSAGITVAGSQADAEQFKQYFPGP